MFKSLVMAANSVSKLAVFSIKLFEKKNHGKKQIKLGNSYDAISNDWKKVGNDMRKGIIKYDRSIAK